MTRKKHGCSRASTASTRVTWASVRRRLGRQESQLQTCPPSQALDLLFPPTLGHPRARRHPPIPMVSRIRAHCLVYRNVLDYFIIEPASDFER